MLNIFEQTDSITQIIEQQNKQFKQQPYQYRPTQYTQQYQNNILQEIYQPQQIINNTSLYLFQEDIKKTQQFLIQQFQIINHQQSSQIKTDDTNTIEINQIQQEQLARLRKQVASYRNLQKKINIDYLQNQETSRNPENRFSYESKPIKYDTSKPDRMSKIYEIMKKKSKQIYKRYKQYQKSNNKLRQQLDNFRQQKQRLKQKYKQQYQEIKNQQIKNIQMEFQLKIQQMNILISNLKDQIKVYQIKIKKLQSIKKQSSYTLSQNNQQIKKLKNSIEKYLKNISQLKEKIVLKEKQIQQIQIKYNTLKRQKTALKIQISNKDKELQKNQATIKDMKINLENYYINTTKLQDQNRKLQKVNKNLEQKIKQIQDKFNKLHSKQTNTKTQSERIKFQNQKLKLQLKKITQKYSDKCNNLQASQIHIQSLRGQQKSLNHFIKTIQDELSSFRYQFKLKKSEKMALNQNIKGVFEQMRLHFMKMKYFSDSIITSTLNPAKTGFIVDKLCKFLQFNSFKPILVYRFDKLNTTNFHRYIDNRDNLFLLVKLANQTVIGGFTSNPLNVQNNPRPGNGFIFNLTDQKIYKMRPDPRLPVHSYDIYYFILGNAQIRLRSQQQKVFSNFGIANSTFDNLGDLRTTFLKTNESTNNELDIITYEFYEIKQE